MLLRRDFSEEIMVDATLREKLQINADITFHALGCTQVELIAMDVTGENQVELATSVTKTPLGKAAHVAKDCGPCFGAGDPGRCCNACAELIEAYAEMGWDPTDLKKTAPQCNADRNKTVEMVMLEAEQLQIDHGCRVQGSLFVNKVSGNFHVALGHGRAAGGHLVHQFSPSQLPFFNTTHTVHALWFGERWLPGQEPGSGALDGRFREVDPHLGQTAVFQYHVQVIPTEYRGRRFFQYSTREAVLYVGEADHKDKLKQAMHAGNAHANPAVVSNLPGVFFIYEISPFAVLRQDIVATWTQFFTNLLAIVGGAFALSRLVDKLLLALVGSSGSAK